MNLEQKHLSHALDAPNNARPPLAILSNSHTGSSENVGGIPLGARILFHLREFGTKKVIVLLNDESPLQDLKQWQGSLKLQQVVVKKSIPETILAVAEFDQCFLYFDTAHLIDPRLIHNLTKVSETTLLFLNPDDRKDNVIRAGFLRLRDIHTWINQGKDSLVHSATPLFPGDIDPFFPDMRGPLTPYLMEITSEDEARRGTWTLVKSQQKLIMDLPSQFIDPPFENALTVLLCDTPITPNMVTFVCLAIAIVVACLFWHGYFVSGALCTFLVEILDGVDGKLARTTLRYSKLGKHEDIIDYLYENSWYVALGVGLSAAVTHNLPALLAGLLIMSDTVDNVSYTLAGKWYGKSIDLFSPFDAAFRRIAGRRNIYGYMFIIGFSLGYPLETFAAAAVWAAVTASIHVFRLIQFGRTDKKNRS